MRTAFALARTLPLSLLVTLCIAAAPQTATAQSRDYSTYGVFDVVPSDLVAKAFAQPYGRALATQFSDALVEIADPACLKTKGLTSEKLADRARALLLERGVYMLQRTETFLDRAAFKSYLQARLGRDGVAEFERLHTDPAVKAYLAADEPAKLAFFAEYVLENVRRYVMITRVAVKRPFTPLEAPIPSIEALNPTPQVNAKLKEMRANDMSGALARYREMTAMAQKPYRDAMKMDVAMKFGPGELLARPGKNNRDLYDELVTLCVAKAQ